MTRRPFRELENDLEDLEAATDDVVADEGPMVGHRDPRTGEVTTVDGEPIPPDDRDGLLAVIEHTLVMKRERAEKYDLEILGPAEDAPDDRDVVEVPADAHRKIDEEDRSWSTGYRD